MGSIPWIDTYLQKMNRETRGSAHCILYESLFSFLDKI